MFVRSLGTVALAVGGVLAAVGLVAIPALFPVILMLAAVVAVAVGRTVSATDPAERGARARHPGRAGVLAGAATAGGCLVVAGLGVVLGAAAGLVILMGLIAAAPVAWFRWPRWSRWWRHRHEVAEAGNPRRAEPGAAERAPAVEAAEAAAPLTVEQLSVLQLCAAWHRSYFTLLDTPAGPARYQVVRVREVLLDELERRDPDGLRRWLEAGARAGSNPGRYLGTGR